MNEISLQEHFARIRNGNRDAFIAVYQGLKQPIFTICYRITASKETAEDITHDVFVKLFRSPPDASVKNLRAWIFQIARNLSIDALRKQSRVAKESAPTGAEDPFPSMDLQMDLEAALQKLPLDEREILSLHLNAGLHFQEIAGMIGLSLPATYRKYRKALKRVRSELNGG